MSAATGERKLAGWARAVKGLLAGDEGEWRSPSSFVLLMADHGSRLTRKQSGLTLLPVVKRLIGYVGAFRGWSGSGESRRFAQSYGPAVATSQRSARRDYFPSLCHPSCSARARPSASCTI